MPKPARRIVKNTGKKSVIVECPHCHQRVILSKSGVCPSCLQLMSAILPVNNPQPSIASVKVYTPKQIFILSFFTGYPTGLVLSSINWTRMGLTGTAVAHWIVGVLLLTLWSAILDETSCGTWLGLIIHTGFCYYLFLQMKQSIGKFIQEGNEVTFANRKSGCLMAFITLSVIFILFTLFVLLLAYG